MRQPLADTVNAAITLYHHKQWSEAVALLAKRIPQDPSDQVALTYLALAHLKLGNDDNAIAAFQRLVPPIPPLAALHWAGLLCIQNRYEETFEVFSRTHRALRQDSLESRIMADLCVLFRDIIAVVTGRCDLESVQLKKRDRLLRLFYPGVSVFLTLCQGLGWCFDKCKLPNGRTMRQYATQVLYHSWAYGFPAQPDFLEAPCRLQDLKGFAESQDVYRRVFQAYLSYWMRSPEDLSDLLLACVKPGDAHSLYCLIREKQPSVILEVGTFVGFSTCLMAQAVKDNGQGKIFCIDPNLPHLSVESPLSHAQQMLARLGLDRYVEMHEGFFSAPRGLFDSDKPVLGPRLADLIPPIDLAFVDGDHATTAVLQDLLLVLPRLQKKATVLFHDARNCPSVREGILTFFQDGIFRGLSRYREMRPSAIDGVGVLDIDKERQVVKEGVDKLIAQGIH